MLKFLRFKKKLQFLLMNKVKIAVYHSPGVTGKHVRKVLIKVIICHQGKQSLYVKAF